MNTNLSTELSMDASKLATIESVFRDITEELLPEEVFLLMHGFQKKRLRVYDDHEFFLYQFNKSIDDRFIIVVSITQVYNGAFVDADADPNRLCQWDKEKQKWYASAWVSQHQKVKPFYACDGFSNTFFPSIEELLVYVARLVQRFMANPIDRNDPDWSSLQ